MKDAVFATDCWLWPLDDRTGADAEAEEMHGSVITMQDPAKQPLGYLVMLRSGRKIDRSGRIVLDNGSITVTVPFLRRCR